MWLIVAAVAVVVLLGWAYVTAKNERTRLVTTRLIIAVPDLPDALDGFTLAFVSDLHTGMLYVPNETLMQAIEDVEPDLLALGGDYAAGKLRLQPATALVEALAARWQTVAIAGNTEHYFPWGLDGLAERLATLNGRLLRNEVWQTTRNGATVQVMGLDSPVARAMDVDAALAQANQAADLRIGLVHSPQAWQETGRMGAHLVLCGHTHGGQVRFPGLEALVTHMTYPRKLASGLFALQRGTKPWMKRLASHWDVLDASGPIAADTRSGPLLYVSRGVGVSRPKMRLLCPPELVAVEFVRTADSQGTDRDGRDKGADP